VWTIPAGLSDRPDNALCDVITRNNLLDLRRHVLPPGVDFAGELQYQTNALMDGTLSTWAVDTEDLTVMGNGDVSTRQMICNEIGRGHPTSPPGVPGAITGATARGILIRNFDHLARRFGDQPVIERVVFAFYPGDRDSGVIPLPASANPGKYVEKFSGSPDDRWAYGDILHLDLTSAYASTLGNLFDARGTTQSHGVLTSIADFFPAGTVVTDVLSVYHDDGHYTDPIDQNVQLSGVIGLGTNHVLLRLDENDSLVTGGLPISEVSEHKVVGDGVVATDGSQRRIFVEVEITYPIGAGTTCTPDHLITPDAVVYDGTTELGPGPQIENEIAYRPQDFNRLLEPKFRTGFREIQLEYVTDNTTDAGTPDINPVTDYIVSRNAIELITPRRIYQHGADTMHVYEWTGAGYVEFGVNESNTEFGSSTRKIAMEQVLDQAQVLCRVEYYPQDPIPNINAGYQISVYYRTNSPQTAGTKDGNIDTSGDGTLPTKLTVEPLYFSENLMTGQRGSGSVQESFPYAMPLDQIAVPESIPQTINEWYFCATANVTIDDYNAETGVLSLHSFVQADIQDQWELGGTTSPERPSLDHEGRAYYPAVNTNGYKPTVMSQPLFGSVRHKNFSTCLARVVTEVHAQDGNGLLFRKNELILIVLSRFAELDDKNEIRITDSNACASVYRAKNMPLLAGV
jgi:hypothetical protein